MKKILIALLALAAVSVIAADTVITGVGSNYTGIGTFQVVSDGTSATLTVDKINALDSVSFVASAPYTTNTITGDGKTNVIIWATAGSVKVLKSFTTTP